MKITKLAIAAYCITLLAACGEDPPPPYVDTSPAGTLIPRSSSGDKGKYYLIESQRDGDIVTAVSKRLGVDSIGFTRTETNCNTMVMRTLGYSGKSLKSIDVKPSKWFELIDGSSKSDLAHFVCK